MHILENDFLKITADDHGAELHSLRSKGTGTEYLWNGNPAYWKYHAPFLFPFVGRCRDNEFRIHGKTYTLPQHGFARISDFQCIAVTENMLMFELSMSDITHREYPYDFSFRVQYTLNDFQLNVAMTTENRDEQPIYFSFGAHPAFTCPIDPSDAFSDCYLEFSDRETAGIYPIVEGGCLSREKKPFLKDALILPLSRELFRNDALIFDDLRSRTVALRSHKNNKAIVMDFHEFPWFGIWSPPKGAPFICLEPWFGHADFVDFSGEFPQKDGIIELLPGDEITRRYSLTIEEPSA